MLATYRLRHFSKAGLLKRIDSELFLEFLAPFRTILEARGVELSGSNELDYEGLIRVFMSPDQDSGPLAKVLYIVDELATQDGMDALLAAAEEKEISIGGGQDVTPAEAALRLWLADSDLVERKHAESYFTNVRSFEFSLPRVAPPLRHRRLTRKLLRSLETDLDDWFEKKRRGRGCRVLVTPKPDGIWFLVQHGEPLRREGTIEEGGRSIVVYRPEKYNVLILDPKTGELGINAPLKSEKELYRRAFGFHLYGDEKHFSGPGRYSLEPLRRDGEASLVCSDVEGLAWVKLRELRFFWGGAAKEIEIRQATDLFQVYGKDNRAMPRAKPFQAKFEFKFTDAKATRKLTIRPPSTAQYTRDSDKGILEEWMARRGFLRDLAEMADAEADR